MNPLVQAYRALGTSAAISAGATAALVPWFLRNDDRGYMQTALFTTPIVAAGFASAPGVYSGIQSMSGQLGQLWRDRGLFSQEYPALLNTFNKQGTSVRRAMHDYVQRKGQNWYAGIRPATEDWSGSAFALLNQYTDRAGALRESVHSRAAGVSARDFSSQIRQDLNQRILLSRAVEEARIAGLTPKTAASSAHILQPKLRTWDQIRQAVHEHQANPDFLRTFARRARQVENLKLGKRVYGGQMLKESTYERQNLGFALTQAEQFQEYGHLKTRLQQAQDALTYHYKGINHIDVIYRGERPIGLEIFNPRGASFNLPLTGPGERVIPMGPDWNHRGTFSHLWDEKGVVRPDEAILQNLSGGYDQAREATQASFQWGGITGEDLAKGLDQDLVGSVSPRWALAERSLRHNPNPYGTFSGGKRWDKLTDAEKHAAITDAMNRYDLTKVGGEGGLAFGKLESRLAEGNAAGLMPSPTNQDPAFRSFSKDFYIDPESIQDLPKTHLSSSFYKDVLGVEASAMPEFSARFGEIMPQVKAMYGDIPAESEAAARELQHSERRMLIQAKRNEINDLKAQIEKLFASRRIAKPDVIAEIDSQIAEHKTSIKSLRTHKYNVHELRQMYGYDLDYLKFRSGVSEQLRGALGPAYESHVRESLLRHIQRGPQATEAERILAGQVSERILQELTADPLNILAGRAYQTQGETIFDVGQRLSGVKGTYERKVGLAERWANKGDTLRPGDVIGFDERGKPITARTESSISDVIGNDLILRERFGISGAKGEGPGAKGLFHSVVYGKEDLLPRQVRLSNLVTELTGVGGIIPEDVEGIALAEYSAMKSKNPFADLMEVSIDVAEQLSHGQHIQSQQFLADLQKNQMVFQNGRYEEQFGDLYKMSRPDVARRYYDLSKKAEQYLNNLGAEGASGHPLLSAYRRTVEAQQRMGRESQSFADYVFNTFRQGPVRLWDHSRINQPAQAKLTFDMLYEMQRAGHTEGVRDLFENVRYPQGDPGMTREVQNYIARGDYTGSHIGQAVSLNEVEGLDYKLSTLESRTGKSIFNPEFAANNLSVDLGGVLSGVKIGEQSVDLRYLPKIGMQGYKGGANAYGVGQWGASELEHQLQETLTAARGIDWTHPEVHGSNIALLRQRAGRYMTTLSQELGGKDGVLRTPMVHTSAVYGVAAERSGSVAGANPFEMFITKSAAESIEDTVLRADILAGNGYAALFRDPNSAAMYMHVRVDPAAHLDANQFGIHSRARSAFQMDHDKDPMKALFLTKQRAIEEAQKAINSPDSAQWLNLKAAEMIQGTENPQNITGRAFAAEAAEKGWSGKNNYLTDIHQALEGSAGAVQEMRSKKFLARLMHGYTGHYSNMTTRLQLMLANSPDLRPGDMDYSMFSSLLYDVRQTAISAGKGKMNVGKEPLSILDDLNKAINQGEDGLDLFHGALSKVAKGTGFTGIYDESAAAITGVDIPQARQLLENADLQFGDQANNLYLWTQGRGRQKMQELLASPNNLRAKQLTTQLTRGEITADDAIRLSQIRDVSPEFVGGILKERAASGPVADTIRTLAGEQGGRMADEVSNMLGAINDAARNGWKSAAKTLKPSTKVLAAGLGVAAVAGIFTTSVSGNKYRPEETLAGAEQIPGDPVAGSRSSVNPKRLEQSVRPSPRTIIAANMRRSMDLEISAKVPDHAAAVEMAKHIQGFTDTGGISNVTVQHAGGWQQSASKRLLRERIKDQLNK